ncbi:dematin-like [Periophthalmus magnuspinnatus]|uniref:dematin-like n=1 Tax=Periophthalmus magnuspinnatus TaxID=409849 RepID=UPI00145A2CB7|nr:dematin-like [Periophthalmus magnuspinnatus]
MMMPKPTVQTSPGSVLSLRPTAPGSPLTITARVDGGVIGYKDLAALPRDKAILEIERPDLMLYQPHYCYSPIESSLSPYSVSPPPSPEHMLKETRDWLDRRSGGGSSPSSTNQSRTQSSMSTPTTSQTMPTPTQTSTKTPPQHFHRPENGTNIYKKPPIYKQASSSPPQLKHMEDLIIESSKFPSAQAPDPNQPSAIETESWPCPPSTAVIEQESRRRAAVADEEEEEETDEFFNLRVRQTQHLHKIQGNLGKILLKDEKGSAPMRRKKTRSLPERTTGSKWSKSAPSNTPGLSRLQSTEFSQSDTTPEEWRQRSLTALHVTLQGVPVLDACGDAQREEHTAPRGRSHSAGAPPV